MKRTIVSVTVIFAVCLIASVALGRGVWIRWWEEQELVKEIGLQKEQQDKINALCESLQTKRMENRTKTTELQKQLNEQLRQASLDEKKLQETLTQFDAVRNEIFRNMIDLKLQARKILTQKQIEQLIAKDPDFFALTTPWEGAKGMRQPPDFRGGPGPKGGPAPVGPGLPPGATVPAAPPPQPAKPAEKK